jgi:uncharacterized protein VirK/YbjX
VSSPSLHLLLRSLRAPLTNALWWRYATQMHRDVGAAPPQSAVLFKTVRRYQRHGLGPKERRRLIEGHHEIMRRTFQRSALRELCDGRSLPVVDLDGRKRSRFAIELMSSFATGNARDGELSFVFRACDGGLPLSRASFILHDQTGELTLQIGCLQGPPAGHKREVVEATRLLHGLRPKDATLLAVRVFGEALGATTRAVAADAYGWRHRRGEAILSDSDEYWRERGAERATDGDFVFGPIQPVPRATHGRDGSKRAIASGVSTFVTRSRQARPLAAGERRPESMIRSLEPA